AGDDVKVETTIEAANPMHVADRATVTITITHPASATFDPIDPTRLDTGRFEVVDVTQTREEADDATAIEHIELVVTLYRVGRFYLPPLRLFFDDADGQRRYVETEQQSVKVISVVLEELENAQLRGVRGPATLMEPDERWMYGAVIGLGVLLLLAIGFVTARRIKARPPREERAWTPPRPAWEVALERLRALEAEEWPTDPVGMRETWFQLSEIMREYLG